MGDGSWGRRDADQDRELEEGPKGTKGPKRGSGYGGLPVWIGRGVAGCNMGDMGRVHRGWVGRLAIGAVVYVLLGATTTVGVAWICARPAHVNSATPVAVPVARLPPEDWQTWYLFEEKHAFGLRLIWEYRNTDVSRTYLRAGWPCVALQTAEYSGLRPAPARWAWDEGVVLPMWLGWEGWWDRRPVSPLWGGLVTDIGCYALVAGLMLWGPGAVRQWHRGRNGQCLACGYDLKVMEGGVCPECGKAAEV